MAVKFFQILVVRQCLFGQERHPACSKSHTSSLQCFQ